MKRNCKIPYVGKNYNFDKAATDYGSRPDYPDSFYQELCNKGNSRGTKLLVDLGCGDARVAVRAAEWVQDVIAVDISAQMLKAAKRRLSLLQNLRVQFLQANATQLPIATASTDMVLIGQAFHWMERHQVTREVRRILKPGGLWLVFWMQPAKPLSPSIQITDILISQTISGYNAQMAHNIAPKNQISPHFGFRVQTEIIPIHHQYQLEDYAFMVTSKSYLATSLSSEDLARFRTKLVNKLALNGFTTMIEEQYLLTVHFAERERWI
jgi:ubiquinone/menaquinone biosynthesis C-methylase UbiE